MFYKSAILLFLFLNCFGNMPSTMDDLKRDVHSRIEKDNKGISPRMQILQFEMSCDNSLLNKCTQRDSIIFAYSSQHTIYFYTAATKIHDGTLSLYEVEADSLKERRKLIDFKDIYSNSPQQFSIEDSFIVSPNLYKLVYQVKCKERCRSYIAVCVSKNSK